MELLPINKENFTKDELLILEKDMNQIPKEVFNGLSLQVRAHLMSKVVVRNLNQGWEEKQIKGQRKKR